MGSLDSQRPAPALRIVRKSQISNKHLNAAQQIIDFVQTLGWDVEGLSIYRYEDISPVADHIGHREVWRTKEAIIKWGLELKVAPRDDEEEKRQPERSHP